MVIKVPFVPIRSETTRRRVRSSFCVWRRINNCGLSAFNERKLLLHDFQNGEYPHWNTATISTARQSGNGSEYKSRFQGPWPLGFDRSALCHLCPEPFSPRARREVRVG